MFTALLLLPILVGCNPEKGDEASLISGTLTFTDEGGLTGDVATHSTFSYFQQGRAIVYMSSAEDVSCDDVSAYLSGKSEDFDPTPLFAPGFCNLTVALNYEGGEVTIANDLVNATWVINCTLEEGGFEYGEGSDNRFGYYWQGRWWQGWPDEWSLTLTDTSDDGGYLSIDATMTDFSGGFTYESMTAAPASGNVSGFVETERCDGLAQSAFFQP